MASRRNFNFRANFYLRVWSSEENQTSTYFRLERGGGGGTWKRMVKTSVRGVLGPLPCSRTNLYAARANPPAALQTNVLIILCRAAHGRKWFWSLLPKQKGLVVWGGGGGDTPHNNFWNNSVPCLPFPLPFGSLNLKLLMPLWPKIPIKNLPVDD
jgi:hypothetical protein